MVADFTWMPGLKHTFGLLDRADRHSGLMSVMEILRQLTANVALKPMTRFARHISIVALDNGHRAVGNSSTIQTD